MATLRDKARASAGKSSGGSLRSKAKAAPRKRAPNLNTGPDEPEAAMPVHTSQPDQVPIIPKFPYLKMLAKIPALRRRRGEEG